MISFIMPAKNVEKYIQTAIFSLQKVHHIQWELIVIEDHSTDRTYQVVDQISKGDARIKLFKNEGSGKISALNYGYLKAQGCIIKFIDSDDVLLPKYFDFLDELEQHSAHCHNYFLVDEELNVLSSYIIHPEFLAGSYQTVCKELISIPRATWSFNREIGDKIFPIPADLPFEDVWFSLIIKKYSESIFYINERLYLYRQHPGQEWGGMINFSKEKVNFRSRWMLEVIDILLRNKERLRLSNERIFDYSISYHRLQASEFKLNDIMFSRLRISHKLKLILICFFPRVAPIVTRAKWKFDNLLNRPKK